MGYVLTARESSGRAIEVLTLGAMDLEDEAYSTELDRILGDDPDEARDVLVSMSMICLAAMEVVTPDNPLAMVQSLSANLDKLSDDVTTG